MLARSTIAFRSSRLASARLRHTLSTDRHSIEKIDAELRRVGEAADALVRTAQELRATLDSLAEGVRANARAVVEAPAPVTSESAPAASPGGGDPDGARIVALNMVLDGKPREEVAAHLRDEFGLADSDALLDDVYSRAG